MFITVQFPLVDFRYIQSKAHKLEKPTWPDPDPYTESMLYFGKIFNRSILYRGPWDGEKRYCNAKSVFNFCGTNKNSYYKSLNIPFNSRILFRRFQSDGKFMSKYEIGFYDDFEKIMSSNGTTADNLKTQLYNHINQYLLCDVKIKIGNQLTEFVPLIHADRHLMNAYFWSSFKGEGKRTFDEKISEKYISKCEPIIITQLDSSKFDINCLSSKNIKTPDLIGSEISLFFDYVSHEYKKNKNFLKTWFMCVPERNDTLPTDTSDFSNYNEIIRYLRINLLRIHAEKVVLKKILEKIGKQEEGYQLDNPATETKVLLHLNKILLNLSKKFRNKQQQDKLVQLAFTIEESSRDENLEHQIQGLKLLINELEKSAERNKSIINISKQIINNMGDQITIGTINGNFINKSLLIDSLNSTVQNDMSEETKQTLLEIAKKIEDSQNQAAAVLFNSFNEELAKPKPEQNKSKLKQFWDGLVNVMPDILTIGKSIAGIVALF